MIREVNNINEIDYESETYYQYFAPIQIISDPHIHDFYELLLIESGEISMFIRDGEYVLKEGDLVLIRPGDMHHQIVSTESCKVAYFGLLKKTMDDLFEFIYDQSIKDALLSWDHLPVVTLSHSESELLHAKIKRLTMLPHDRKRLIRSQLRVLLTEIINHYYLQYLVMPFSIGKERKMPDWLSRMLMEMEDTKCLHMDLTDWCGHFYLSKEYICRTFKKFTGTTFNEHLNSLKINYAANMLAYTNIEIIDVALECGYQNLSHFYHLFRANYGVTPKQYRSSFADMKMRHI